MRIRTLAVCLVCASSLWGQARRFSWQDLCFKNPGAPVCQGNDYAIKRQPPPKPASPSVVTNPTSPSARRPSAPQGSATPAMIVVGAVDWRFADPFADALIGLNLNGLTASPLGRSLIVQLGAKQGLTEADVQKIFDGLSGVDQVALSVRNNRVVVMLTGHVTDAGLPAPEAGLKAVSVSAGAMLVGHADAVDQAVTRISMKVPPTDSMRMAEAWQAGSEFWVLGSPSLLGKQAGPQALSAGIKRFSLAVSIRSRLTSDLAFEFSGVPSPAMLQTWQTKLGATSVDGNTVHLRTSMEADEVQQKFGEIAAGPLGQPLAALVESARHLPMRDTAVPRQTHPVIYGLDDGPRVVNQTPDR